MIDFLKWFWSTNYNKPFTIALIAGALIPFISIAIYGVERFFNSAIGWWITIVVLYTFNLIMCFLEYRKK